MPTLLRSISIPANLPGGIEDFDVVVEDGRPMVLCAAGESIHCWDSLADTWTRHHLENPWRPGRTGRDIELESIAATIVDGRIIVGGGGDHQSFAAWDLHTGQVRHHADPDTPGVHSVVAPDWGGAAPGRFIVGESTGGGQVLIIESLGERPTELTGPFDYVEVGAGMLCGQPVLITDDGGEVIWNAVTREPVSGLSTTSDTEGVQAPPSNTVTYGTTSRGTGLVTTGNTPVFVVVNDTRDGYVEVILCDPFGDEWSHTLPPHDDIDLDELNNDDEMTAGFVGNLGDRPIAAAAMSDCSLHLWDLKERRPLPPIENEDIRAFGCIDYRGTPCLITLGDDGEHKALKLWKI